MKDERTYRTARDQSTISDVIRTSIYNIDFMRLGYITNVYGDGYVVDVECFNDYAKNKKQVLKGVELMRTGSKDVFIHLTPQTDDIVAVFSFRDYVKEIKKEKSAMAGYVLPYSQSCMKGIVIQPTENEDKAKLIFKIKDDEISVTSKMPINFSAEKPIEVSCNDELKISGMKDIGIEASGAMTLKATQGIEIDGTTEVKIVGSSGVDINNGNLKVL